MLKISLNQFQKKNKQFLKSKFFPHIIIDNFLNKKTVNRVSNEIDGSIKNAQPYYNYNVKKLAINNKKDLGSKTYKLIKFLNSKKFIKYLEKLTSIKGLIPDPRLEGGGIHIVKKGGYLNIHADFQSHIINSSWERKINLLLYFNDNWKKNYNGNLELWSPSLDSRISILPKKNRVVIFHTGEKSFHGHPKPLDPPTNKVRKSIALYYYVDMKNKLKLKETNFVITHTDNIWKKIPMKIDQFALRVFSYLKRKGFISDIVVTKFIKLFTKSNYINEKI